MAQTTSNVIRTYGAYINGEWVGAASGETFENRNPSRSDEIVSQHAKGGPEDVQRAVQAASDAARGWAQTSPIARANIFYKAADIMARRATEIGEALTREEGKTIKEGVGETMRAVSIIRYFCGEIQQPIGEQYPSAGAETLLFTTQEPLGVVGIITPWNFPIAIPTWKSVPALIFGNTVVLKPATDAPLCSLLLAEVLEEAGVPPGVFNVVTGSAGDVGDPLVRHQDVAAVTFTGSAEVGNKLKLVASERGAKVQLELGGKNPAIVMADADLEHAITNVINGAMMSTGQKCTATSRAIVDRRIAHQFTDRLVERIDAMTVGDPLDESTQMGPAVNESAAKRIKAAIESARASSATFRTGDRNLDALGNGHFVSPTVFDNVEPDSELGQDEIFGPVLGVMPVDDIDEAIHIANGVTYGLSASLFTTDLRRALTFVREIQAGVVHVNSETAGSEPQVPFGGYKGSSSYSREQGKASRDFFTQTKTVYLDPPPA